MAMCAVVKWPAAIPQVSLRLFRWYNKSVLPNAAAEADNKATGKTTQVSSTTPLRWLAASEGREWLERAASLPADQLARLQTLRPLVGPERAAALVEQLQLRKQAAERFPQAGKMLFTRAGLEQSTAPAVAQWRASLFPENECCLDLCCGIGGDLIPLAQRMPILAADSDSDALFCARHNLSLFASKHETRFLQADVTTLSLPALRSTGFRTLFCDPARRTMQQGGMVRTRSLGESSPPLHWMQTLRHALDFAALKLSPAVPRHELELLGGHTYFVSYGRVCREACCLLHLPHGPAGAVLLQQDATADTMHALPGESAQASPAMQWLVEPDPALIRAGLTDAFAVRTGCMRLAHGLDYLTAHSRFETPWADFYRILDAMPYHPAKVKQWLQARNARVTVVKQRGTDLQPEQVRRQLQTKKTADGVPLTLVLARIGRSFNAILCEPLHRTAAAEQEQQETAW